MLFHTHYYCCVHSLHLLRSHADSQQSTIAVFERECNMCRLPIYHIAIQITKCANCNAPPYGQFLAMKLVHRSTTTHHFLIIQIQILSIMKFYHHGRFSSPACNRSVFEFAGVFSAWFCLVYCIKYYIRIQNQRFPNPQRVCGVPGVLFADSVSWSESIN